MEGISQKQVLGDFTGKQRPLVKRRRCWHSHSYVVWLSCTATSSIMTYRMTPSPRRFEILIARAMLKPQVRKQLKILQINGNKAAHPESYEFVKLDFPALAVEALDAALRLIEQLHENPARSMPYIVLSLFGLYTLEFGVVGILPVIIERFGVAVAEAGRLMGLFALIVAICGPFLVLLSSPRIDRKKTLTGALFGSSVCSVLSAYAPNFASLMVLRIVPALLHPVFFAAAVTAALSLYPRERAARATALAVVGTTLGLVIGVPMTTSVAARFSYEASFLFCAVATGVAGVRVMSMLPRQKQDVPLSFGRQLAILRKLPLWLNIAATVHHGAD